MINHKVPFTEIQKKIPKLTIIFYLNKIYNLTNFVHPGGNFILQKCKWMEVSRYIKGIYSYPFIKESDSNVHSINAYKVLDKYLIGKFELPISVNSSILVDSFLNKPTYSNCEPWRKITEFNITNNLSVYFFKNDNFFISLNLLRG